LLIRLAPRISLSDCHAGSLRNIRTCSSNVSTDNFVAISCTRLSIGRLFVGKGGTELATDYQNEAGKYYALHDSS
jgi:uncharacterized UBP type Zn finger protein